MFLVGVKSEHRPAWRFLYHSDTLAAALAAYRALDVRPGQAKALVQQDQEGWHVLAQVTAGRDEQGTEQEQGADTDQAPPGPPSQ
jgi:hypothetical protein